METILDDEVTEVAEPTESAATESETTGTWDTDSESTQSEVGKEEVVYRIIGRVHLSTGYLKDLKPTYLIFSKPPDGSECIDITMSIHTLAHLTS